MQLLFVIGLQKSGTSLLNRLLMKQDFVSNPFLPEGRFFWGDNPPDEPVSAPCGELFQMHHGNHGHHLDATDYREEHARLLEERIRQAGVSTHILMNKNPNNSVRVPWLKKVFPQCHIVAVVRNPVSNIYSLLKKVHYESAIAGNKNALDWWGIKPKGWKDLASKNLLERTINQWNAVNGEILSHNHLLDSMVEYSDLCQYPNHNLLKILSPLGVSHLSMEFPALKCFDDEYEKGSRLLSKNVEMRKHDIYDLSGLKENQEFPPLERQSQNKIRAQTGEIWTKLKRLAFCHG